jgi:hypothetical protein
MMQRISLLGVLIVKRIHFVKQVQVQLGEVERNGGRAGSSMDVGNLNSRGDDRWCCIWKTPCPPKI